MRPSRVPPPPNAPVAGEKPRGLGVPGVGVWREALPDSCSMLRDVGIAMEFAMLFPAPPPLGAAIWMPCTGISVGPLLDCRMYSGCWEFRSYTACRTGVGIATEWGVLGGGAGEEVGVAAPPPLKVSTVPFVNASTSWDERFRCFFMARNFSRSTISYNTHHHHHHVRLPIVLTPQTKCYDPKRIPQNE